MKSITRWMLIGAMSVSALLADPKVDFSYGKDGCLSVKIVGTAVSKDANGEEVKINLTARPANDGDLSFLRDLFGNPDVMGAFGNGQIRSEQHVKSRIDAAKQRFGNGSPHGSMIILDDKNQRIGWAIAGEGDEPGASEVALALIPDAWKQGYGESLAQILVQVWAPLVRTIGLGKTSLVKMDPLAVDDKTYVSVIFPTLKALLGVKRLEQLGICHSSTKEDIQGFLVSKAFQCFGGEALNRLDATTSPTNTFMQGILEKAGFKPAQSRVKQQEVILSGEGSLSEQLNPLYQGYNALEKGTRYEVFYEGKKNTFSWSKTHDCIKLHYEHDVVAFSDQVISEK